jgi:DNA-binding response OmpR family regulator
MTEYDTLRAPVATRTEVEAPTVAPEQMRLLHVEDNAADALLAQEYIRDVLPQADFDTATRLGDVTSTMASSADCAILDLSLPDAEGLEALVALRAMSDALPIIVLTGFDNLELGLAAVRDGADDYLIKNHVDGYSLERAVRYSIERRRLTRELISSAAAATVATAAGIAADAATAVATELADASYQRGRSDTRPSPDVAAGTHEVAVRIDQDTGEYTLACRSCTWRSDSGSDTQHSWAARSLDAVLLRHITLGDAAEHADSVAGSTTAAGPGTAAAEVARTSAATSDHEPEPPLSRRAALSVKSWLG